MVLCANFLKTLLNGNVFCALCFEEINEKKSHLHDQVIVNHGNTENVLTLLNLINTVLGEEIGHNILTPNEAICKTCLRLAVTSYKFIKTINHNFTTLHSIANSVIKSTVLEAYNYDKKALYLVLDPKCHHIDKYYDKKLPTTSSKSAVERIDRLIQYGYNTKTEIMRKETANKDKKSYTAKIETKDMLHDKNDKHNLKCKECLKIFLTVSNLRNHFIRVHAPKNFECSICHRYFGSLALLEAHKYESHVTLICSECGKIFNNRHTFKMHEIGHHFKLVCKDCGRVYRSQTTYKKHFELNTCKQISRASPDDAKYTCDYCNKRYTQKTTLRVHIQHEHLNYKSHDCKWCMKKFWAPSRLKAHMIKHTQDKKFQCNACGRKYVSKESLLYHTRSHTGEKPYKCNYCEQKFVSASRKADHLKRLHSNAVFQCTMCKIKYTTKICLENHMKTHEDGISTLDDKCDSKVKLPAVDKLCFMSDEESYLT